MKDDPALVHDDELHAHVDGQLDPARLPAVLAWLQQHPDAAARVLAWQTQRQQLRRLAQAIDPGPTPAALRDTVLRASHGNGNGNGNDREPARHRLWLQAAAVLLMVTAGVAGGHRWGREDGRADGLAQGLAQGLAAASAGSQGPGGSTGRLAAASPPFVREAQAAHAAYVPETRHPVEVGAADEAHLLQWLSRRLGAPLKAPTLGRLGYQLLGGRLLPGEGSPRAQFMYENPSGARVTLYVTVFDPAHPPDATAFRTVHGRDEDSFYWVEERYGYALNAQSNNPDLQALAREVYGQLQR